MDYRNPEETGVTMKAVIPPPLPPTHVEMTIPFGLAVEVRNRLAGRGVPEFYGPLDDIVQAHSK